MAQQTIGLPLTSGGAALTLDIKATDPDDAKAKLTYKLLDPVPAGATLDAATGRFTFSPKLGDALTAPPATITLAVVDGGSPPLSTQASFKIEFKPADILAELRKKLDAAKTVGEISGVIEAAASYRGNEAVDQKGLTTLTADAFVKRGDAHIAALNFDAAAADFNTVVRDIDVNHIDARLGRAFCFGRKGDWRAAVTEYDDVIALDAENIAAYLNRAAAHYELKDMSLALADADRAVQLMPENPAAFYVRGNAKVALKDRAGALADLKEAVKLFSARQSARRGFDVSNGAGKVSGADGRRPEAEGRKAGERLSQAARRRWSNGRGAEVAELRVPLPACPAVDTASHCRTSRQWHTESTTIVSASTALGLPRRTTPSNSTELK